MEFPFDLVALVGAPPEHQGTCVGCVDERSLGSSSRGPLSTVLEELGQRSAVAQGLRKPVTYGSHLGDQRVYLLVEGNVALGLLKVGRKKLFVAASPQNGFADVQGAFREIEPVCCLDFYVHERCQRAGLGKVLFEAMLRRERLLPEQLGYDRPSPKLMAFLNKHYGLHRYQPQSNNFVVFENYFHSGCQADRQSADRSLRRGGAHVSTSDPVHDRRRGVAAAAQTAVCPPLCPPWAADSAPATALGGGAGERRRAGPPDCDRGGAVRDLFGSSPAVHQRRSGAVDCR